MTGSTGSRTTPPPASGSNCKLQPTGVSCVSQCCLSSGFCIAHEKMSSSIRGHTSAANAGLETRAI
eukprot:9498440-Pyramimonas_sp.AAC.1